ncbi:hypothetical protein HAX54_041705 [Datura stramonium]|uniref:Uncharacterized protein n=1 Tax=Datura stramonium TaxID=4076 RepID=A0ABS8W173_DATST|nr:hypothetical protein [Datura stramonium]
MVIPEGLVKSVNLQGTSCGVRNLSYQLFANHTSTFKFHHQYPIQEQEIIMASQNDENLAASSSNAMSLEAESPRPSQLNEVVESRKRKRYSKVWDHFKLVHVDGVPYGQCLTSTIDKVSCPTLIDEEEESESSFMTIID